MKTTCLVLMTVAFAGLVACSQPQPGADPSAAPMASQTQTPQNGTTAAETPRTGAAVIAASRPAPSSTRELPVVTLHLAGDSTVMTYAATSKQEGWGQEIGPMFNDKVKVNNVAIGGASVVTFKNGNWNRLIGAVKPGDFVMIQFGANDSGTVAGRHVEPADFGAMYRTMAQEVKAKGGTPIFVTPSAFFQWSGSRQDNARLAPYSAAIKEAGAAEKVSVVDLNARGVEWLGSIGQTEARNFYMPNSQGVIDKAHFVKEGAVKMAGFVVEEVKKGGTPLGEYVKE